MLLSDYPFIVSGEYATFKGKFYVNKGDHWRQIEKYLPGAIGTLGESFEATAHRWLKRLNAGESYRLALTNTGQTKQKRLKLTEKGFENEKEFSISDFIR